MELSQLATDIIGYCSMFLLWLPLLAFVILLLFNCIYCSIQDIHLEKDYLRSLSNEDRKLIEDYKENTSYIRVKRRLRRIRKNLLGNNKDTK